VWPEEIVTAVLDSEGLKAVVEDATDLTASVPAWLQADHDNMVGKVLRLPDRTDIDIPVQEQLIVELYSK
jgi:small subunit ribosomal protein S4